MLLSQKLNSNLNLNGKEEELPLQLYEKGEEIAFSDSRIWQVYRGVVELSKINQDGKETILGWMSADSTFGNGLEYSPALYRAVALSDVYVRWYSPEDIHRSPLLARQLLTQFSDRLIKSEQLLAIIATRRIEDRLQQLLLMLKQEIGQSVANGMRLQVRFTHQHLAEAICTTRVTVTKILGDFQGRGWIYLDQDRHIVIKN